MSEGTSVLAEAHAAYLGAQKRAARSTTAGLRLTAWRLGRRRERLALGDRTRLKAVTIELGHRAPVQP